MSKKKPESEWAETVTEYDEEFIRIYKKLHGEEPREWNMISWHRGLRDIFGALANIEANISGIKDPLPWSKHCAESLLRALDRRTDKAWAFNLGWKKAATYAEVRWVHLSESSKERYTQLVKWARLEEAEIKEKDQLEKVRARLGDKAKRA